MSTDSSAIVSKVWNYAHVLKNAGGGYGDYVEQITYLLLAPAFGLRAAPNPAGCLSRLRLGSSSFLNPHE